MLDSLTTSSSQVSSSRSIWIEWHRCGWRMAGWRMASWRMGLRTIAQFSYLIPLLLVGCTSTDSDYLATNFLLSTEPDGVQTVLEVREALLGPETTEHDHEGHEHEGDDHDGHAYEGDDHDGHAHEGDDHDGHEHEGDDHDGHDPAASPPSQSTESVGPAGPIEVVVVGKIGGLANPWQQTEPDFPFVKDTAKFFLADPAAVAEQQAEGHQHAPGEECAFCAAHAQDTSTLLAIVQFKDKQGQLLRHDTRKWLALKGNETVVVHGQARIIAGGLLVIDADGLYVRR
jgi:hypothetical protein